MAKICPNCNKEWPDEFIACPIDMTPLVTKVQQTDGVNLNLGDANAISGGINVSDHRIMNTTNNTTNNVDSHNITNNITHIERSKSPEELLHEKKLAYRKACQDAFSNGVLSSDESKKLEEYRNTLGLDNEIAKRILTDVRSKSSRKYDTLGPVQQIAFDKIKNAISQNQVDVASKLFPELKAIAQSYTNEEVLFTYYMLQVILLPKDCIQAFETRTEDSYWQTFWVSIAYKKIAKNGEAMKVSAELRDKWMDIMPQENEFILAATNNVLDNDLDNARICFTNVEGMHSTELLELVASLYTILSPDFKCTDVFSNFYLNHLFSNKITLKDGSTKEGMNIGKYFYGYVNESDGYKEVGRFLNNVLINGKTTGPDGEIYEGGWKDGKKHGHGKQTWPNGAIYEGEWKDGEREGIGKLILPNGAIYEGEWRNGEREGQGKVTFSDGKIYEGDLKKGRPNGHGKMTFPNDEIYEGEWKDGDANGHGKTTFPNGEIYEGEWKDGKPNGTFKCTSLEGGVYEVVYKNGLKERATFPDGKVFFFYTKSGQMESQGKIIYPDGRVYVGEFDTIKSESKEGQGIQTWPDGRKYKGGWKNDKREGQGRQIWPGGTVYEGEWKNDKREGQGKQTSPDGFVYEGRWKNGCPKGQFRITSPDGVIIEGEFKDGNQDGHCKITGPDGEIYEGECKEFCPDGQGKMTSPDGEIYEGEWKDGEKHGHGKQIRPNGDVYEGDWKNDIYEGRGKCTFVDGHVYEGEWKKGKREGQGKLTWPDGAIFEGEWNSDRCEHGKMTYPDGRVYKGDWKKGRPNGQGKMIYPDGRIDEGEWKNGKFKKKSFLKKLFG